MNQPKSKTAKVRKSLSLPKSLVEAIEEIAKRDRRSFNFVATELLTKTVRQSQEES